MSFTLLFIISEVSAETWLNSKASKNLGCLSIDSKMNVTIRSCIEELWVRCTVKCKGMVFLLYLFLTTCNKVNTELFLDKITVLLVL